MRSHSTIISDAGGPSAVARILGVAAGTVKQWGRSGSIPGAYWFAINAAGLARFHELAVAVAKVMPGDARAEPTPHPASPSVDDGGRLAPDETQGAEKNERNVSRTGAAA